MLSPEIISELNAFRGTPHGTPVCPAPSINMHFSPLGVVTACCFNLQQVMGVYPRDSVDEIWRSRAAEELRAALSSYDLTKGCGKCAQQIEARDFSGAHAVFYTELAEFASSARVAWGMPAEGDAERAPLPLRLEFNIHNSCNLQCVMCHGLASSAIRTHREGLAAPANPYDEAFVDQLEPYLPYVVSADFLGGEPFLIPTYRVLWERIAKVNPRLRVGILTNGTILDDSIKKLLEGINCAIDVSIDSHVKETYESIRLGASYETVMENSDYFRQLMKSRGAPMMWRFCPMRMNWREIPDLVDYCNARGIVLTFNQVDLPLSFSLHTLAPRELTAVIGFLKKNLHPESEEAVASYNRNSYGEFIRRLEGYLDHSNRLNALRARIATTEAVIDRNSLSAKEKVSQSLSASDDDACAKRFAVASTQYVTTQLNIEHARQTESLLPEEFDERLSRRRGEVLGFLEDGGEEIFLRLFLEVLVRTHWGVWGNRQPQGPDVFPTVEGLSEAVASRADVRRIIDRILDTPPRETYARLASDSTEELLSFFSLC